MSVIVYGSRAHKDLIDEHTDRSSCLLCASSLRWAPGLQKWVCPEGCDLHYVNLPKEEA